MVCGLLRFARNDEKKNCHCEALKKPWQSQYGVLWQSNKTRHCESCLQLVAISVWGIIIYSWNSFYFLFLYLLFVACGLLRFARNDEGVKGNDFFLFSVFIFAISGLWIATGLRPSQWRRAVSSGLWGFASLCKGGSCEATGGLRKNWKWKIENWKLIFHLKLILWLD